MGHATRTVLPFLAAASLGITACGGHGDHGGGSGEASGGKGVDRAFAQAMVPHHESAVEMARMAAERGESAFVRQLAADIVRSQTAEITTLKAEDRALAADGVRAGDLGVAEHEMGMDHDLGELRTAKDFDAAFLRMMVPHHEGAITMAKAELAAGEDPELRALAQDIIAAQRREIAAMERELGEDVPAAGGHAGHGG